MNIRLHAIRDGVSKLGPGIRFVVWTQGCPRQCPGCMTPESQPLDLGYEMDVESLARKIILSERNGLTISGGEPFLQAEALTELIRQLKKKRDIGVIIYTGYTIEELRSSKDENYNNLIGECDLIIDGRYIESLNDGKNGRGSSNQRAIAITDRYVDYVGKFGTKDTEIELFFSESSISMVGIPSQSMLERFKKVM